MVGALPEIRAAVATEGFERATTGNGGFPPYTWQRQPSHREHACAVSGDHNQEPSSNWLRSVIVENANLAA